MEEQLSQEKFVEYRNKLLKLRKEGLKEIRRQKMKKLNEWLTRTYTPIIAITMVLLLFVLLFTSMYKSRGMDTKLKQQSKQIEDLLNANNTLVKKVVEFQEQEIRKRGIIRDYIIKHYQTIPPLVATEISKNIIIASEKYHLPVATIVGVMERESRFNPTLRSKKGARGLMQVMPIWVEELGLTSRFEFHNIQTGIDSGAFVLRYYLEKKQYNMEKALFQYVGGDPSYVRDVYKNTAKFVVFQELNGKEVVKEESKAQLDEEAEEIIEEQFVHTVVDGDTLSLIAEKYSGNVLDWTKIHKLNPEIIPKKMQIGTKVKLPIEMKPNKT